MKYFHTKGFSIIELIVAISIFVTITSVLLVNYNSINKRLSLDTLAHLLAQTVREAQVSAMSVKSHVGSFGQGYGLHFEQASSTQFVFFADLPDPVVGNRRYDLPGVTPCGNATVECVKTVALTPGNSIEMICGANAIPVYQGTCPSGFDQLDDVDIVFTRPNPDAEIMGDVVGSPTPYGNVVIHVKTVTGYSRSVSVWTTGQVTVQQ